MIEEPFASGNSVIHRLDPRFRVAAAILYSIVVAVIYRFMPLGVATGASAAMLAAANLGFIRVMRRLLVVNGFVLLFWLVLPVTAGGEVLYPLGFIDIYRSGVILSAQITLKANAILMALIALTATMSFATLGHAMNQLHFPEKLVYLLILTYRYIFVIDREYRKILRAIKVRGFSPGTSLHCYRTYAYVIGMLFVRASARAERVYRAMRCRGFSGRFHSLAEFQPSLKNWIFTAIMASVTITIIYLEIFPHE